MQYTDSTLATPEQNLACDEALLERCDEEGFEILRFWEPREYFVVLGYSNEASSEVHVASCRANGIPILRRCSGGGTVLQGKGCLNYSLILNTQNAPHLQGVRETNRWVMERHQQTLARVLDVPVKVCGFTDLALGSLKFSGNAQRRGRQCLLFHGTFLLQMDLAHIETFLALPSQQPSYRQNRSHSEFLTNLKLEPAALKQALAGCWKATQPFLQIPWTRIEQLVAAKYSQEAWNRIS